MIVEYGIFRCGVAFAGRNRVGQVRDNRLQVAAIETPAPPRARPRPAAPSWSAEICNAAVGAVSDVDLQAVILQPRPESCGQCFAPHSIGRDSRLSTADKNRIRLAGLFEQSLQRVQRHEDISRQVLRRHQSESRQPVGRQHGSRLRKRASSRCRSSRQAGCRPGWPWPSEFAIGFRRRPSRAVRCASGSVIATSSSASGCAGPPCPSDQNDSRQPTTRHARRPAHVVAAARLQRAADQNRRLGGREVLLERGVGGQLVGQRRAKHVAGHEGRIDPAKSLERQIAQAAADRIADQQCTGQAPPWPPRRRVPRRRESAGSAADWPG